MVSAAARPRHLTKQPPWWGRWMPVEGWVVIALHILIIIVAARAIEREEWADGLTILTPVAILAVLTGLVLAKTRIADLLAHFMSFAIGVGLSISLTAMTLDDVDGSWRDRLHYLWTKGERWYDRTLDGRQVDDSQLFIVVMGITIWLVAYSSAWMLYRRRWLLSAVALPGAVILINHGYAPDSSSTPLFLYLLAALILAARHFAFRRQVEWSRSRIPSPTRLPWHFVRSGLTVASLVVALGLALPVSLPESLLDAVAERLDQPIQAVQRVSTDWLDALNRSSGSGGSFSQFGESFRLGGELNLSEDPVALLDATRPLYLAVHRYDNYDGHGWSTDVQSTFRPIGDDGELRAPSVTFPAQTPVFLSPRVTESRTQETGVITVYRPKGDLLLTVETYLSSSERASVQLGWQQLENQPFPVQDIDLADQPVELRNLIGRLQLAEFDGAGSQAPMSDPELQREIAGIQADLAGRYLETHWEIGEDGRVETLFVTGQLPVYDDVEAVLADRAPRAGERYIVTGMTSLATPEELRSASEEYPTYVTDRYISLPNSVTDRTRELASQVAAGSTNSFDRAYAIQEFLRQNYTYDEKISAPPDDQDVVDYLLFESKRGYCEYYASAMIVMLRELGIPARMVTGFRSVPFDPEAQGFLYRERQAHTWVEAFFPGYGWIPFEPTPIQDQFEYGLEQATPEPEPVPAEAVVTPTPTPQPAFVATPPPTQPPQNTDGAGESTIDQLVDRFGWITVALSIAVALAGLALMLAWLWGLRGLAPAAALYARALRIGRWWGVRASPSMTPTEFAAELGRAVPGARGPARVVADLYAAEAYGQHPPTAQESAEGKAAWRSLRGSLIRSLVGRRSARRRKKRARA